MSSGKRGVYIASKAKHGPRWQALRAEGLPIVSTWIDESGPGETADYTDLWCRSIAEASNARVLIAYCEPGEMMKGALVEIGAALAAGVPVLWVDADDNYTASFHPLVVRVDMETAIAMARAATQCDVDANALAKKHLEEVEVSASMVEIRWAVASDAAKDMGREG